MGRRRRTIGSAVSALVGWVLVGCGGDLPAGTDTDTAGSSSTTEASSGTTAPTSGTPTSSTSTGGDSDSEGTTQAVTTGTPTTGDPSTGTTTDTTTATTTTDTTGDTTTGSTGVDPCAGPDSDGDGVGDACDVCPDADDTLDADADGVPDGCDVCPDADDNADADADGVPDGCDVCPDGDDNADADTDSVPDGCDACPDADDNVDADGDSVPDACDVCPDGDDTLDADADSVPDACDVCPDGDDALDGDGDGVPNACDACPDGDDALDLDADGIPDACDPDSEAQIPGPLHDFDSADDGTLVLTHYQNGQVLVTCFNPDLSLRKAQFVVGDYDTGGLPPGPTVDIARSSQKAIVVWHDRGGDPANMAMEYVYLDAQCEVIVPATKILKIPSFYMEYHASAIDAEGNAVIAVSREDTRVAFINSQGEVTSEQIAFDLPGTTYGNHVAMNQATGEGIVSAQPHSGGTLYYRRFNADGTWKDPAPVAVAVNYHYWYDGHTVGMNDLGQFVLLWRSGPTTLDARVFDADGSVLANIQRPTPDFENGSPFDSFRRRHSEIPLRGNNFVLGETFRSKPPGLEVMHFEYTPNGALVTEDSTDVSPAMVLAIRVTPGGRTYLHNGQMVLVTTNYP